MIAPATLARTSCSMPLVISDRTRRYWNWSTIAAVSALVMVTHTTPAAANLRPPVRSELPPSSSLFSPSRDLSVLHEDLQFDCDSTGCQVTATYYVHSKERAALRMSFISPSRGVEAVTVNNSDVKSTDVLIAKLADFTSLYNAAKSNVEDVDKLIDQASRASNHNSDLAHEQLLERSRAAHIELDRMSLMRRSSRHLDLFGELTPLADAPPEKCYARPDLSQSKGWEQYIACLLVDNQPAWSETLFGVKHQWELYRFDFDVEIRPGENSLQVRYHQPYSLAEPSVAYFNSPSPLRYVSYEIWPLKDWSLDLDFKIDLVVRLKNSRHGFLYMKRDDFHVAAARFEDRNESVLFRDSPQLPPSTLEVTPDGVRVYKTSLHGNIPDRLFVVTGEEASLEEVRKTYEQWRKFRERTDESRPRE